MSPRNGKTKRRPAQDLTGRQRRHLRSIAHHLDPLVQVGKEGVTPALEQAVDEALTDHELVKVRVLENAPQERGEAAGILAEVLGAHVVGQIGRVIVLYRMDPNDPGIQLPKPVSQQ